MYNTLFISSFNDVSTKRIPSQIDEDSSLSSTANQSNNQSDSLLNESTISADLRSVHLNGPAQTTTTSQIFTDSTTTVSTVVTSGVTSSTLTGEINRTYDDVESNGVKETASSATVSKSGKVASSHRLIEDDGALLQMDAPQTASSPLAGTSKVTPPVTYALNSASLRLAATSSSSGPKTNKV